MVVQAMLVMRRFKLHTILAVGALLLVHLAAFAAMIVMISTVEESIVDLNSSGVISEVMGCDGCLTRVVLLPPNDACLSLPLFTPSLCLAMAARKTLELAIDARTLSITLDQTFFVDTAGLMVHSDGSSLSGVQDNMAFDLGEFRVSPSFRTSDGSAYLVVHATWLVVTCMIIDKLLSGRC